MTSRRKISPLLLLLVTVVPTVLLVLSISAFGNRDLVPEFGADGGPEGVVGGRELPELDDGEGAGQSSVLREDDPATDPSDLDEASEILPERYLIRSVPWRPPSYANQEGALGWNPHVFEVPENLRARVEFWKAIYSRFTSDQGVLHDVDDVTRVYAVLDFTKIARDASLSAKAKSRARTKLLNGARADVQKRLQRLSTISKELDVKGEQDREFLRFFTRLSPADLFKKENKGQLKNMKDSILKASKKKRVRFQLGQKDKFILGVYYSGRYLKEMERIFREEGLPIELTRLPFVESSFNIKARSRVGARGIWQFMPRTAKTWMMVNREIDERNDPLTATRSAARLMKANYTRLETWPLALTAYNHGASGLVRAVRKTKSRDLGVIVEKYESRRFGFASSNFYACFLAAIEVEKNARELLGDVKWSIEFDGQEIDIRKPLTWRTLVDIYDGESALTELQNTHINVPVRKGKKDIPRGTFVRVPSTRAEIVRSFFEGEIDEAEMRRRIAVIPIPRMQPGDSAGAKLGVLSEAARALLPFLMPTPSPTPSDLPEGI
jgi:membrane-bound lytic murein transglycosylase D